MGKRYKRGEVNLVNGKKFWAYDEHRERWVDVATFDLLVEKGRSSAAKLRAQDPKRNRDMQRAWRAKNPERAREISNSWRLRNPERAKELSKKSRKKHAGRRKAGLKSWQKRNPEGRRKWDKAHPKKHQEYAIRYRSKRRAKDPLYRLRLILSSRTSNIFKIIGLPKKQRSLKYLGCSIEDFKKHIEKQFLPGMTWDNQGLYIPDGPPKWQIDHVFPLSMAKTEDELKSLCHYTNQRPLWGVDNIKKGNKVG